MITYYLPTTFLHSKLKNRLKSGMGASIVFSDVDLVEVLEKEAGKSLDNVDGNH